MELSTPELSDSGYPPPGLVDQMARLQPESASGVSSPNYAHSPGTSHRPHLIRPPSSPSAATYEQLIQEAHASGQFLQDARATLSRAQSQTQDTFQRYTACLEAEARARREVVLAEQHRDELMSALLSRAQTTVEYPRHPSLPQEDVRNPQHTQHPQHNQQDYSSHHLAERRPSIDLMTHNSPRSLDWRQPDVSNSYPGGLEAIPQSERLLQVRAQALAELGAGWSG